MKIMWLFVALVLLTVGLYRLFTETRTARTPAKPARKPEAKADPSKPSSKADPPAKSGDTPKPSAKLGSTPKAPEDKAAAEPRKPVEASASNGKPAQPAKLPSMVGEHDPDEDITIITIVPSPELLAAINAAAKDADAPASAKSGDGAKPAAAEAAPPKLTEPSDEEDEAATEAPSAIPILYDEDASIDEPTRISPLILVSAASQTDQGRRRRRNEDSMLVLEDHHLYVVADGMGGHAGGDVASKMAVERIGDAFKKGLFEGDPYPDVPRRGAELALAIQMANKAIWDHARANAAYQGMGTTVVAARFSPNKQRVYFGHVGDSRCYRLRNQQLTQITTDHTMASQGVTGPLASHLNRAVGVQPGVKIDLIIARPSADDVYLLCSDGLSKMVQDEEIQSILNDQPDLEKAVARLVERANARGGRDNITVVLVQVKDPKGIAKLIKDKSAVV